VQRRIIKRLLRVGRDRCYDDLPTLLAVIKKKSDMPLGYLVLHKPQRSSPRQAP
jgi:hypothetical protein